MHQNNITGMTLCSGIGAPEVAAPWVDWRFASEIEPFPRAVLQERFGYRLPEDHNQGDPLLWGDMTEVTPELMRSRGVPLPDLIVAGTPCQAFSVAGARKGLADARGNLTLAFVETCHAIAAARSDGKLAVLWENVPGVLSDKGNAFGCFLGGLVGALDALPPPGNGSWPSEGMVQGPRARAAWAVLDAQWFGVAQRRRRVFVVVDFGNCVDPAAVLLEPDRLRGDSPPRREAGQGSSVGAAQGVALRGREGGATAELTGEVSTSLRCAGGGGDKAHVLIGADAAPTLSARTRGGGGLGTDFDCDGGLIASTVDVAHCLNAGGMGRQDYETETMVAHTLKAEGFDASEDGTGRGTPLVPVAFDLNQITSKTNRSQPDPAVHHTLPAATCPPHLALPWAVRRLTPTETLRLQGFPDMHTAITYRGKPAADGPQYKAHGNSMCVNVMVWILSRMKISMEAHDHG